MSRSGASTFDWHHRRELERRMRGRAFQGLSRAVAGAIVGDNSAVVLEAMHMLQATPADLLFVARCHGVSAYLVALGGTGTPPWAEEIQEGLERESALIETRGARLAEDLRTLGHAAHSSGIRLVPLKGSYLRSERYSRPALRPAADIDLLASPGETRAWSEVLAALGYSDQRVTAKHLICAKPAGARVPADGDHPDHPRPVELHERIGYDILGRRVDITSAYLAGLEDSRILGDVPARVPRPPALALHLVLHSARDMLNCGIRLAQLFDLRFLDGSQETLDALHTHLGQVAWAAAALADRDVPGLVHAALSTGLADLAPGEWRRRAILSRPGLLQGDPYRVATLTGELLMNGSPVGVARRVATAWRDRAALHNADRSTGPAAYLSTLGAYLGFPGHGRR